MNTIPRIKETPGLPPALPLRTQNVRKDQIEARTKPIPEHYPITPERIGEPVIVIRQQGPKPYLAAVLPECTTSIVEITVVEADAGHLLPITFFRAQWLSKCKTTVLENLRVVKHLLDKGWTKDQILYASGFSVGLVNSYVTVAQKFSPEFLTKMFETGSKVPMTALLEIKHFPLSHHEELWDYLVATGVEVEQWSKFLIALRDHIGIHVPHGQGPTIYPKGGIILPQGDDLAGLITSSVPT